MDFEFSFDDFATEIEDFEIRKKGTYSRVWSIGSGGSIQDNPLVFEGAVYFGCVDQHIFAIDSQSDEELWRIKLDGIIAGSSPWIRKRILYIGSYDGRLYAIDIDKRKIIWTFKSSDKIFSSPFVYEDKVYFGSKDSFVYCIDADSGKEIWRFKTGGRIYSNAFLFENSLCFGSWDCYLYCIDAKTGKEVWRFQTSTSKQSYIPPVHENFEAEIKIPKAKEDERVEDRYARTATEQEIFGEHFYTPHTEYKTKSEYK